MISEKTLQHPILVFIVFALLTVLGLFTLGDVAISLMPDFDSPYLSISAAYANAGPESVEKSVTTVIEDALAGLNNLKSMTSSSSEGSGSVSLEFSYGTDLEEMTNDVRDKLDRVARRLPDNVTPTIFKMDADSMPIMRVSIRGNRSADDLKMLAENTVADILEQASGVGEASVMGGRTKIVRVELDQNRLQAYGIPLTTVSSALSRQNLELGGGTITEDKTNYSIRTTGEFASVDEINGTVIQTVNGYPVRVSDLGRAFMGYEDATSEVYINGQPGVYISITKQSGENSVTVANAVYKKIEEAQAMLPGDVTLEIVSDTTEIIRDTINTLIESAVQGLVLAVIILYIFLCSVKSTIIIAISIPLSMLITLLCMFFAGITLNMMTLTGLILGVGMIVDASIVMIDNIYAYRSRGTKPRIAAILGSNEMMMSVLSGNLTTICVFIPFLFFMSEMGMYGQVFKGMIFTIVIALVSSIFVAMFLVPVLAGHFFPLTNRNEKPVRFILFKILYGAFNKMQDAVRFVYRLILRAALNNRIVTTLICFTLLILSCLLIPTLRFSMMTGGADSSVTLNIRLPTGTTLSETAAVVTQFEEIAAREVKGYKTIISSIGGGGRRGSSTYSGSLEITLPDSDQRIDGTEAIQNKLRAHFNDFTDVTFSFGRGMRQQMTGDDFDVVVRSSSLDDALAVANQVSAVMQQNPDISEPSVDTTEGLPQVEVVVDRQRAYSFGVSVTAVANEIYGAIQGVSATTYREDGEDYSVYVMLRPEDRERVIDLEQVFVQGTGGMVSVANFASVKKGLGPVSIRHENRMRTVHVTASNLSTKNANVVENDLKESISRAFIIPDNVTLSYEGAAQEQGEQFALYLKIGIMAILLVFGVMAATYESFLEPFINLMTIPFLIIGFVLIHKLTGQIVSIMSIIGIVMLVGIVVNNGIILVDYTNLLVERGMTIKQACLEAGTSRLRPVMMTTLTTVLGMLPMCFATSGSAGMVQPLGVAVAGGLTSSTFITLFFIPVLYSGLVSLREKVMGLFRRLASRGTTTAIRVELPDGAPVAAGHGAEPELFAADGADGAGRDAFGSGEPPLGDGDDADISFDGGKPSFLRAAEAIRAQDGAAAGEEE